MKLFSLVAPPAPPRVGAQCLHQRVRQSGCEACRTRCPAQAFRFTEGRMRLDEQRCVGCGICLFVCPCDAIENLSAPARAVRDGVLLGPFTLPVSVEELLMWHAQHQIRAVALDPFRFPGWAVTLAALNLQLRKAGQTPWRLAAPSEAASQRERRRWLRLAEENATLSVTAGSRARRRLWRETSEYVIALNQEKCTLCGACGRICSAGAMHFAESEVRLNAMDCTGCRGCEAVCPVGAVAITRGEVNSIIQLTVSETACPVCKQPRLSWPGKEGQPCPLCLRHHHGMREA